MCGLLNWILVSSSVEGYERIAAWIKKKHGLLATESTPDENIKIRLESIYDQEYIQLKSDIETGKRKGYRNKKLTPEKLLAGFKAFIEEQDYTVFRENE